MWRNSALVAIKQSGGNKLAIQNGLAVPLGRSWGHYKIQGHRRGHGIIILKL